MERLTLPALTEHDAQPARLLWFELRTRITTQPLHYRGGDEETAARSVYELFPKTRQLLAEHWQAEAFAAASIFLLNHVLRPNTARWHRWMVDGKFTDEFSRRQFRYELQQLQPRLTAFARVLEQMATQNESAATEFAKFVSKNPAPNRHAELGGAITAGIAGEVPLKQGKLEKLGTRFATAAEIDLAEHAAIRKRRDLLGLQTAADGPLTNATALCLSGGGIRSATFCLGIVQALARQRLLERFDYMSTVSGGGYLGTFLTACLGTPAADGSAPSAAGGEAPNTIRAAIEAMFTGEGGRESAAVRHLRNNSRFLLSGGLWARLKMFGLVVTGILTNILLMLPIPLIAVLVLFGLAKAGLWEPGWSEGGDRWNTHARYAFWPFFWSVAAAWLLLPWVRSVTRGAEQDEPGAKVRMLWESTLVVAAMLLVLFGGLLLIPFVFEARVALESASLARMVPEWMKSEKAVSVLTAVLPLVLGLFAARSKTRMGKKWMTLLFALSGPLLAITVFLLVGRRIVGPNASNSQAWWIVASVTGGLWLWGWILVDINQFSPHNYYRNRLAECYLAARVPSRRGHVRQFLRQILFGRRKGETFQQLGIGALRKLPLSQMNESGAAPYHLVNAAVNLPSSREPNLRGRDCDFYTFGRDYCGGPICGYIPTKKLEELDGHVDLGTAMAVSGAAASSNMGVNTLRHLRFLLALLNVRLGYWLRNPIAGVRRFWNVPGPRYLLREMAGWMHEKSNYLNISDGGHIENLALYEMLRRRCKFIVVVDGGMEPGMECADLMLAQRYAEIDLGIDLDLDVADLALNAERRSRAYAVFGKIRYRARKDGTGANDLGWMIYLKLARTGSEPGYVLDYGRRNPDFPHQTTGDQMYDEAQFEAYRRLGECAAESLFRAEIADPFRAERPDGEEVTEGPRFASLDEWFEALATSLLPDNDPAFDRPRMTPA